MGTKPRELGRHAMSVGLLSLLALLAIGSTDTEQETKAVRNQVPAYDVTANALAAEYEANEVAADTKYKGKVVYVYGVIRDIGKDVLGAPYIVIGGEGFLDGVQCTFSESQTSAIAKLWKGQQVRVQGEVSGKMGNVLVRKCSIE